MNFEINRRKALVISGFGMADHSWSQSMAYPTKPIKIIVPTPPGGGADYLARLIGQKLSTRLSQAVLIENRPGAAGDTAAEQVSKMAGDGYTIFIGAIAILALSPFLYKNLPFDSVKDFTQITKGVSLSNLLVAHPSLPVNNVKELIAYALANPGAINYSSSGNATAGHLAGVLFSTMTNTDMVHIPYKGGGPAMNDLIAGHVQISFASPPSAMPYVKNGRLKVLAVSSENRQSNLLGIPTIAETVPGFSASNWYCFIAPPNLPKEILDKLNAEIRLCLQDSTISSNLVSQGMIPEPSSPEDLTQFIVSEMNKWGPVIKRARISVD